MSKQQRDALDAELRGAPFDLTQTPEEHRAAFAAFADRPLPADVIARDVQLAGVPALELEVAGNAATPTVLYFHGGGYVVGSAHTGAGLAAEVARRIGGRAVSVEYRLAPEHRFPAAVEDGVAFYAELVAHSATAEIVVAGDSAGGGLALATLVAARERGLPQPAAVALFSPWTDLTLSGESVRSREGVDPLFTRESLSWYVDHVLGDADPRSPLVSPVFADLTGLPPLLVQVGAREVLLDDALRLVTRAAHDDVEVVLDVVGDVPHVFQKRFAELDEADAALERVRLFFAQQLDARAAELVATS